MADQTATPEKKKFLRIPYEVVGPASVGLKGLASKKAHRELVEGRTAAQNDSPTEAEAGETFSDAQERYNEAVNNLLKAIQSELRAAYSTHTPELQKIFVKRVEAFTALDYDDVLTKGSFQVGNQGIMHFNQIAAAKAEVERTRANLILIKNPKLRDPYFNEAIQTSYKKERDLLVPLIQQTFDAPASSTQETKPTTDTQPAIPGDIRPESEYFNLSNREKRKKRAELRRAMRRARRAIPSEKSEKFQEKLSAYQLAAREYSNFVFIADGYDAYIRERDQELKELNKDYPKANWIKNAGLALFVGTGILAALIPPIAAGPAGLAALATGGVTGTAVGWAVKSRIGRRSIRNFLDTEHEARKSGVGPEEFEQQNSALVSQYVKLNRRSKRIGTITGLVTAPIVGYLTYGFWNQYLDGGLVELVNDIQNLSLDFDNIYKSAEDTFQSLFPEKSATSTTTSPPDQSPTISKPQGPEGDALGNKGHADNAYNGTNRSGSPEDAAQQSSDGDEHVGESDEHSMPIGKEGSEPAKPEAAPASPVAPSQTPPPPVAESPTDKTAFAKDASVTIGMHKGVTQGLEQLRNEYGVEKLRALGGDAAQLAAADTNKKLAVFAAEHGNLFKFNDINDSFRTEVGDKFGFDSEGHFIADLVGDNKGVVNVNDEFGESRGPLMDTGTYDKLRAKYPDLAEWWKSLKDQKV